MGKTTSLTNPKESVELHVITMCALERRGTVAPLIERVVHQALLAGLFQGLAVVAVQRVRSRQHCLSLAADHCYGDAHATLPFPTGRVACAVLLVVQGLPPAPQQLAVGLSKRTTTTKVKELTDKTNLTEQLDITL